MLIKYVFPELSLPFSDSEPFIVDQMTSFSMLNSMLVPNIGRKQAVDIPTQGR